ncbi:MAG TPA: exosortase [Steroidobacteraceae bacterium]|nr:exosortase [Steroidobacteraceae bacterium]
MSAFVTPSHAAPTLKTAWPWAALLAGAVLAAYAPTLVRLFDGPWRTEQQSQGPLIIGVSLWLMAVASQRSSARPLAPAPVWGWCVLVSGLALLFCARALGLLGAEVLSAIAVIGGCVLLLGGRWWLATLAFPIGFLLFAVPLPDWMIDAVTLPLKVFISDAVTAALYAMGYPVAQNGVSIVIGPYEVLVKDACSGLNSIVALLAVGTFYVYAFRRRSAARASLLLAAIIPLAIAANFLRVLALVLIVYYSGIDALSGPLHLLTGLGMFVAAALMLLAFDGVLSLGVRLSTRISQAARIRS